MAYPEQIGPSVSLASFLVVCQPACLLHGSPLPHPPCSCACFFQKLSWKAVCESPMAATHTHSATHILPVTDSDAQPILGQAYHGIDPVSEQYVIVPLFLPLPRAHCPGRSTGWAINAVRHEAETLAMTCR